MLRLDAGSACGRRTESLEKQTRFLMEEMAQMGHQVLGVGHWDLNYGLEFLREMARTHDFRYVSSNLRADDAEGLLFSPYEVVEVGGVRVGLISVIGQSYKITTMSAHADNFVIESPRDALDKYLPELKQKCDLVVLLSNASTRDTRQLLMDMGQGSGIDICIEGADSRQYRRLNKVGDVYLVSANPQGKYLGQLDLTLTKEGYIEDAVLQIHELGKTAPEDAEIKARVDAFLENNKASTTTQAIVHTPTQGSATEKYLGVHTCANCHKDDWDAYRDSGHAKAWQSLVEKSQTKNPDCVSCHVVGFDFINGYDARAASTGRETLYNVQCEACHGYGTGHDRGNGWAAKAKDSCAVCHTRETDPDFDYASDWAKIAH